MNSGSSANFLMYYAAQLSGRLKNKRVVVPALSWATTVAPAFQLGFEPIMCDAELASLTLDLDHLERLLVEHDPAAVIVVHTLGIPNHMDRLLELKRKYGFLLMEDACPSTGSRYRGRLVGTFGEMSSFSFYFGHHISTIEGGMVATSDEELHDIMLHTRSHGWAKDVDPEKEARLAAEHDVLEFNRVFTFYHPGLNFRSTDLNALHRPRPDEEARLGDRAPGREPPPLPGAASPARPTTWCRTTRTARSARSRSSRWRRRASTATGSARRCARAGIETRPLGGGSMGRQPFWTDRMGTQSLPVADRVHETSFMLPNHPHLSLADVDHICDVVLAVGA